MQHCAERIGDAYFRTPRNTIKEFVNLLAVLEQNPEVSWEQLVGSVEIREEKGWGRVLVRDQGPGFSPDALSRAYDPFYTTTEGGLGVGLSHARHVVEDHGGRIHLRNSKGGGAEVEIALPVSE